MFKTTDCFLCVCLVTIRWLSGLWSVLFTVHTKTLYSVYRVSVFKLDSHLTEEVWIFKNWMKQRRWRLTFDVVLMLCWCCGYSGCVSSLCCMSLRSSDAWELLSAISLLCVCRDLLCCCWASLLASLRRQRPTQHYKCL